MRWMLLVLMILGLVSMLSLSALQGCEEVLDSCPTCGSLVEGDMTIAREPRIDGSFEALQRIRMHIAQIRARFEAGVARLSSVLEGSADAPLTTLADQIGSVFDSYTKQVVFPTCAVDRTLALEAERRCEDRLCNADTASDAIFCAGVLSGQCDTAPSGGCFEPAPDSGCTGLCIGVCDEMADGSCPGTCTGSCDAPCNAYAEDGTCNGTCSGQCSGRCQSDIPFNCDAGCFGACEVETAETCTEGNQFFGSCEGTSPAGRCFGHLLPVGCGDRCGSCAEDAAGCRETAKHLAWSALTCEGGAVRLLPSNTADSSETAAQAAVRKAVEDEFATLLADYVWLSAIVDGQAVGGDIDLGKLLKKENTALSTVSYADLLKSGTEGVARDRVSYPLENLKARFYWFEQHALDSKAGYRITASGLDCLTAALDEAEALLNEMLPTTVSGNNQGDETAVRVADQACATEDNARTPDICLYGLLDDLQLIVNPLLPLP